MAAPKKKPAKSTKGGSFSVDGKGSRGEDILAYAKKLERGVTGTKKK